MAKAKTVSDYKKENIEIKKDLKDFKEWYDIESRKAYDHKKEADELSRKLNKALSDLMTSEAQTKIYAGEIKGLRYPVESENNIPCDNCHKLPSKTTEEEHITRFTN